MGGMNGAAGVASRALAAFESPTRLIIIANRHPPTAQLEAKDRELRSLKNSTRARAKQAEGEGAARAAQQSAKAAQLAARAKAFHKELLAGLAEIGGGGLVAARDVTDSTPGRGGGGAAEAE
jgi:hypothetical protein